LETLSLTFPIINTSGKTEVVVFSELSELILQHMTPGF
jgi:ATP phosphoribosyltransferase